MSTYTVRKIERMWVLEESPSGKWVCCTDSAKYFRNRCKALNVPFDLKAPVVPSGPLKLDIVPETAPAEAPAPAPAEAPTEAPAPKETYYKRYYAKHREAKLAYLAEWHKRNRDSVLARQKARYHKLKAERAAAAVATN